MTFGELQVGDKFSHLAGWSKCVKVHHCTAQSVLGGGWFFTNPDTEVFEVELVHPKPEQVLDIQVDG